MRKIHMILAALCCCAAMNAANYDIKIAGKTVTDANKANVLGDGKVSYDPASNTVTLNGASIDIADGNFAIDCSYSKKLTIVLKSNSDNYISVGGVSSYDAAIQSMGPITITSEENPGYVAKLRIITYSNPELYTYKGDVRIEGPIDVTLSGSGATDAGNVYNTNGGKFIIDGATVKMMPCRIRMDGTTITRSKITSPTDAVLSSDGTIIREGGYEYATTTMVTVTSQLHKLFIGANPQNTGNYVQHGEEEQPSAKRYYEWFEIGQKLNLIATAASDYEFYGWYRVRGGDTKMIADENPYEYTVNSEDEVVYAQFDKKHDFVLSVYPKNLGNLALCEEQPTDASLTLHYTTGTHLALKAIPGYGYKFKGWCKDNEVTPFSTDASLSYVKDDADETIHARFEKDESVVDKVLPGTFTVWDDRKVRFAAGNLQFQPFTHLFRFAANQNEVIGDDNKLINDASIDWFDLFGWGTGDNPARISTENADYATWTDWGVNPVVNGGNEANQWRTLEYGEWWYIFYDRADANLKWGLGIVNGVKGLILLPDDFPALSYITPHNSNFNDNRFEDSGWNWMEQQGAVFLPVTGFRYGTVMSEGWGYYWSTSPDSEGTADYISITENGIFFVPAAKCHGQAVRLVQEVSDQQGISNVQRDNVQSTKVLRDGQLFIERDGKIYNAQGTKMQ